MKSFVDFIREQGVVGFATGFILGGSVTDLVKSFINDLVNPFVGLALGSVQDLKSAYIPFFGNKIAWGDFLLSLINFIVLATVVFLVFKVLQLEKLDKPKK